MTTKHTPGPWNVYRDAIVSRTALVGHVADNGVIWYVDLDRPEQAEALANAHLIAAAPELLAACESLLHLRNVGYGSAALLGRAMTQARAAIAKAKGDTK